MRNKINRHLHKDEKLMYVEVPSWMKFHRELVFSPLIFPLIHAFLKKISTHLVITNDRVIARHGIIGEHSKGVKFNNIVSVKVHQPAFGSIFNYGHIHLYTQSGGHSDLVFHYIKNPIKVKKVIEKGVNQNTSVKEQEHRS